MLGELQVTDPRSVGPYRLLGRLGSGGMGRVYLGRSVWGRLVAVKVIRPELAAEPGFRMRFAREVTAARNVSGLFTALVVDADVSGPVPWLATVYVAGPSLAEAVADQGPLPVTSVLALAAGLAEGLHAIHAAGVVHRDLKPANVLLADDGPRVIDFGISRPVAAVESAALTLSGTVLGSPGFMSPEQAEGRKAGPPSDVFSLGAVLMFAATGAGPFGTGSSPELIYRVVHHLPELSALPAAVRPLVEPCLARDPRQRPTTGELMAALGGARLSADWLPGPLTAAVRQYPRPRAAGHTFAPTQPWALEELFAEPWPGDAAERRRHRNRRHLTWVSAAAAAVLAAASASAVLTLSSAGAPHHDATDSSPRSNVAAPPSAGRTGAASPRVSPTTTPASVARAQQATTRKSSTTGPASSGRSPTSPAPRTPAPTPSTPTTTPTPTPTASTPTPTPTTPTPTTPTPTTPTPTPSTPTPSTGTATTTRSTGTAAFSTPAATRSTSTPAATRSTSTPAASKTASGPRRRQWAGDRPGRGRARSRRRGL